MTRKRNIVQWGNSTMIMLKSMDLKDLGIEVGDEVDIEDIQIIKNKGVKKK